MIKSVMKERYEFQQYVSTGLMNGTFKLLGFVSRQIIQRDRRVNL
jgi:hypothetical protein